MYSRTNDIGTFNASRSVIYAILLLLVIVSAVIESAIAYEETANPSSVSDSVIDHQSEEQPIHAGVDTLLATLTEEERAWLRANATSVELWYNPSFPPLEYEDDNGRFVGMGADVMSLVESRLDVKLNRQVCRDWNRHLAALKEGARVIAPTIVQTDDRDQFALFTTPYARVPVVIIGTADLGQQLTLDDLEGLRVAVVKGYATEEHVRDKSESRFEIVTVGGVEEGLREVAFGQVDAYVENLAVASHYIRVMGITNLHVVGEADYEFIFRIAVSRQQPELHSIIQKALDSIGPDELKVVAERWIALSPQSGMSEEAVQLLLLAGAFLVLLIIGLVVISAILKRRLNEKVASLELAQKDVVRSEIRYRRLFHHAPLPLVELTIDGTVLRYNEAAVHSLGYDMEDVSTLKEFYQVAYPDPAYREQAKSAWEKDLAEAARSDGRVKHRELHICCKDGSTKTFLIGASVVADSVVVSLTDIDQRKRMEMELESSRERFAALFEMAPFECAINDFKGRYLMVNQRFCESLAKPRDQIVGQTLEELGVDFSGEEVSKPIMDELERTGTLSLREISVPRGSRQINVLFASRVIDWADEKAIMTASIDITGQKETEEELRREKESLRVTLDSIGDAVIATDTHGLVTRMNAVAEGLTGWSLSEAEGRPLGDVFSIVNAKTRMPITSPVVQVLESGQAVDLANHSLLIARDGQEYQIADSGAPIRTDDGGVIGVVLVFRDVTQEHAIQEQLRQSQKMQAVGQLAGGVAHDFNNMLGAIIGGAELIGDSIARESSEHEFLNMISEAAERAADLTRKLLVFSRRDEVAMKPIDAHRAIRDALALLERTIDPRIRLDVSLSDDPIEVMGDQSQIQNAVLNLLINATHAMPDGGVITVRSQRLRLDELACKSTGFSISPGHYIEVEVRDTGCGIPQEHLSRIFEPFFSTKEQGKGTGLGLSAVFGTVEQHSGAITVYSELDKGTAFRMLLPTTEAAVEQEADDYESLNGSGRILLVDDEPALRKVAGRMLTNAGYQVVPARNGRHALELFSAENGGFDLVILDMTMPVMNGTDCFYELRKLRRDVRVVLASGFSREEDLAQMLQDGLVGSIRKPFRSVELNRTVRQALQTRV